MRLPKVLKRFRHIRFFAAAQNDRETTCAHGECLSWRKTRMPCADVGRKTEMCAGEMPPKA